MMTVAPRPMLFLYLLVISQLMYPFRPMFFLLLQFLPQRLLPLHRVRLSTRLYLLRPFAATRT